MYPYNWKFKVYIGSGCVSLLYGHVFGKNHPFNKPNAVPWHMTHRKFLELLTYKDSMKTTYQVIVVIDLSF